MADQALHDLPDPVDSEQAVAVDLDGALLATAEVRYPTTAPRPGWAEQDPGDWWKAACTSTASSILGHPHASRWRATS
jgi:sugar (pentulose or hexulose) kinase